MPLEASGKQVAQWMQHPLVIEGGVARQAYRDCSLLASALLYSLLAFIAWKKFDVNVVAYLARPVHALQDALPCLASSVRSPRAAYSTLRSLWSTGLVAGERLRTPTGVATGRRCTGYEAATSPHSMPGTP